MSRRTLVLSALAALALAAGAGAVALVGARGGGPAPTVAGPDEPAFIEDVEGRTAVVWAVGDVDTTPAGRRVASRIAAGDPDRVLYLGDVYEDGTAAEFRAWARTWGSLARRTAPTPGNHEWPNAREGYRPFWRDVHGRTPPSAYAFRAGGWEILSLNSQASTAPGSEQERWLRRRVAARDGTCRIVFWHLPRFSAGEQGDHARLRPLWRAAAGDARVVLSGHDHNSQRLKPIDGLTQFVAGAGGRRLYDVDGDDRRLAFGDDERFAALRLDLRAGRARHAFVSADGSVLDAGEISCTPLGR